MSFDFSCKHYCDATIYLEDNGQSKIVFDGSPFLISNYHRNLVYTGFVLIAKAGQVHYLCKRNDDPRTPCNNSVQNHVYLISCFKNHLPYLGLLPDVEYVLKKVPNEKFIKFLQNACKHIDTKS